MSDENWIFPFFEPRLLRLYGWDSLWSARAGVCVRVCMRCSRRWNKLPCLSILFPSFSFSLENGKSFDSWEMIFGDYAKGCSQLWYCGVSDTKRASIQGADGPKNRDGKFHIFKRVFLSPLLKMSVGCLLCYHLPLPYARHSIKSSHTSNAQVQLKLKVTQLFRKTKNFFLPFFGRTAQGRRKNGWEKIINKLFFASLFSSFHGHGKAPRKFMVPRVSLSFLLFVLIFFPHSFDTIFKNFLALGWKN